MTRAEFLRAFEKPVTVYPYRFRKEQGGQRRNEVQFDPDFGYEVDLNSMDLPDGCPEELREALSGHIVIVENHKTGSMGPAYLWLEPNLF